MYLELGLALYLKSHWYSGKMTSIRQIIQDFQEWTTPANRVSNLQLIALKNMFHVVLTTAHEWIQSISTHEYLFYNHVGRATEVAVWNATQYVWVYVFPLAIMARTTSVWLTVAIAAQRCIAVTMPLKVKYPYIYLLRFFYLGNCKFAYLDDQICSKVYGGLSIFAVCRPQVPISHQA